MSRLFRGPKTHRNSTVTHQNLLNHPDLTLPMEKQGAPPTNGRLGGTTCHIQQHTSTQSIPWPSSYSLTTSTSILDPLWALPTQHLQGWPASTCLRPNHLETFRHALGHPDSPSYVLAPQVCPDHLQITCSSTGTCGTLGKAKTGKLQRFWCQPGHPVHRAGATIMAHTYPLKCGACILPHHP